MKIESDNPGPEVRIEIIPLIDVIFCVLTFFILAALQLSRQQSIPLNLPQAVSGRPTQPLLLAVSVDAQGHTYLNHHLVNSHELEQVVQDFVRRHPTGTVALYAARSVPYNDVVRVLDSVRVAGAHQVALATLQP